MFIEYKSEAEWLELRKQDVTSTDVSAVLGVSPYKSRYVLWLEKSGQIENTFEDNDRVRWGRRLEETVAHGIAEDFDLREVKPLKKYARHDKVEGIGASFDFECVDKEGVRSILEIKTVDHLQFLKSWYKDGDNIEAPLHIELQVQAQLACTDFTRAYIGVLTGGNQAYLIKRDRDDLAIAAIESAVKDFWDSVKDKNPPSPDWRRDYETVRDLHKQSNAEAELSEDDKNELAKLLPELDAARAAAKVAEDYLKEVQAKVLHNLKSVERATIGQYKVTAKTSTRKAFEVKESTVRRLDLKKIEQKETEQSKA